MTTLTKILEYFFSPIPAGNFQAMNILLALAVVGLIVSIGLRLYLKKQKEDKILRKLFRTLPGKIQTISIILAVYVGVRYIQMPFLSMRIMQYIILAAGAYVILRTVQTYYKEYPELKKHHDHQMKSNQYLPRKKHRK